MKLFLLGILLQTSLLFAAAPAGPVGEYRLHLYFGDTTPFVDDVKIERDAKGVAKGTMHVPNDFDGVLENITESAESLEFDLFVPKNLSRPVDLVFHYRAMVHQPGAENLSGLVTLAKSDGKAVADAPYIGSFVAFKRTK